MQLIQQYLCILPYAMILTTILRASTTVHSYYASLQVPIVADTGMSAYLRVSADISCGVRVLVLQLICYNSSTLKVCLNLLSTALPIYITALPIYITANGNFDYGVCIVTLSDIYLYNRSY